MMIPGKSQLRMSTASNLRFISLTALLLLLAPVVSHAADEKGKWFGVEFPHDSPVVSVGFDFGPSTITSRGPSMVIDLHAALTLRNVGTKPICGLTLRVEAQDLSPHGRGSVIKPSLFVLPGEEFPVKVDMQLVRPISAARSESAMVQVTIDCALFSDLKAYGPDKLNSKRTLMVYEMEARRDRQFLTRLLDGGRLPELREELNFGNQDFIPRQLGLELLTGPRTISSREQALAVSPVNFPKGPGAAAGRRRSGGRQRSARTQGGYSKRLKAARRECGDGLDCPRWSRDGFCGRCAHLTLAHRAGANIVHQRSGHAAVFAAERCADGD
jgi:hypothetical protein